MEPDARRRTQLADGVAGLAQRYGLSAHVEDQLVKLHELLTGDPSAPTAIRDSDDALRAHLADSLVGLELPRIRTASSLVDIGSGAGLPGLVLAIALPNAAVALVESSARKCRFLTRAVAVCEVPSVRVVNARAEEWREGREWADVVTARAVAPLPVLAEYAAPLLRVGGALVAWQGRRDAQSERAVAEAAAVLGMEVDAPIAVKPYRTAEHRHLHVIVKERQTPAGFPRRPGMARKRPLGGKASDRGRR